MIFATHAKGILVVGLLPDDLENAKKGNVNVGADMPLPFRIFTVYAETQEALIGRIDAVINETISEDTIDAAMMDIDPSRKGH